MTGLSRLHARHWERVDDLAAVPLSGFERSAGALAAINVHIALGDTVAEPWLAQLREDFWVPQVLLPPFLEALPTADADFFIALCKDHARIAKALEPYPRTLCHGDLRRANIAYVGADVVLFDWELASAAPVARDLEWYWFLQFWAYPPDGRSALDDPDDLRGTYLASLERERGVCWEREQLDTSGELAFLSVLCQIGCCLADPLSGASAPEAVARAKRVIAQAIDRAHRIHDRHVR